jgi:hypothetical protein
MGKNIDMNRDTDRDVDRDAGKDIDKDTNMDILNEVLMISTMSDKIHELPVLYNISRIQDRK